MRIVRALALLFVLGVACQGSSDLALEITVPGDLVSKTKWFEVAAYRDTRCKALGPMLLNGLPEGLTARAAFEKDPKKSPPVFGKIPNGQYAFGAVARDKDCTVLARGCTEEPDVSDASKIVIELEEAKGETGKCPTGTSCQAARCVPANDNQDPSVGAGCSLELLGAGALLHVAEGGALMSAPAIAPTSTGFIIAYRENAGIGGAARLILLPVDAAGGLYGADKRDLNTSQGPILQDCAREAETDGIGLVTEGENGMLVIANSCGRLDRAEGSVEGPMLQLVPFDVKEDGKNLVAFASTNFLTPTSVPAKLGAARSAVGGMAAALTVYTEDGTAKIAGFNSKSPISQPVGTFGGGGVTDAWIAANEQVLALLALGTRAAAPAGDGGDEGEPFTGSELRFYMLDAGQMPNAATAPTERFPGTWASIAAVGGRVIVLSDGAGIGSVTIRAFDRGSSGAASETSFSVEGEEEVTAGDVTVVGDRAYFAALKPGKESKPGVIELHVFKNATTSLTELGSVSLGREPRVSGLQNVGDGRVAVAASSTRVAVAWTTKKQLDENDNDPAGGYAVFACRQ